MTTKVVNVKTETYNAFIGRPSIFGNPFKIGPDGTREEVIEKFKDYFYKRLVDDSNFKARVLTLKDKTLGCYCKPLPCHGDIIAEYLDKEDTNHATNTTNQGLRGGTKR